MTTRNLRIVVVNAIIHAGNEDDEALHAQVERARVLRIGLLEAGYDIVASLPPDMYLPDRIAQLQPDKHAPRHRAEEGFHACGSTVT